MDRNTEPFEIIEVLGEGSFGTVCVARVVGDPQGRQVALKILKGAYAKNPKILNRTRDEARLLSKLSHPNIVRVERLMEVKGRPVVVMEHVRGISVDQLLLRFKDGIPGSIAIEVIRRTLQALHHAYFESPDGSGQALRVIHRDIKPSNMLLSTDGELKVVDFGIAKGDFEGREADTESVVMGSRPYMAPERLDGVYDSPAVDVYSSGMSLYELLTGHTMSLSINPATHKHAMAEHLRQLRVQGLSLEGHEALRTIIRGMCAYDRNTRPTAIDSIRDLEQCSYAVDPRYQLTLVEFARTTVVPIYESRPRIRPEDAIGNPEDTEFIIKEVTGQSTDSGTSAANRAIQWFPYLFLALLSGLVLLLAMLAAIKFMGDHYDSLAHLPFWGASSGDDTVEVQLEMPPRTQVQLGDLYVGSSGRVVVPAGLNLVLFTDQNGTRMQCTFVAKAGTQVQLVQQGPGHYGLSVNDQPATDCTLPPTVPR